MFNVLLTLLDLFATLTLLPVLALIGFSDLFKMRILKNVSGFPARKLLVLDMAYTLEIMRERQLFQAVTCRDLDGYFDHVWSVHPCATIISPKNQTETYGSITLTAINQKHTLVEGKVGRYRVLKLLPIFNLIISQYKLYRYLIDLVRREEICVVRAGDPYYLGLWSILISTIGRIPCAVRVNCNYDAYYKATGFLAFPRLFKKRWVEKLIDRFTLKRMDLVAAANEDIIDFVVSNGARKEVCTVFRYGNLIHPFHFQPVEQRPSALTLLEELGLRDKLFSITISRLENLKRPNDVIRVIAEVRHRGTPLKGLLIGDGKMLEELKSLAFDLGISEGIVFAGNRDQKWISTILPHAAVVIGPSMGRALTEAALAGVPIVAYDYDWHSELIKMDETGILVTYGDWQAMADAVIKIINTPEFARRIGEGVLNAALDMMDPVKSTDHEKAHYSKLFIRYYGREL